MSENYSLTHGGRAFHQMTCNYQKTRDVRQAYGFNEWGGAVGASAGAKAAFPPVGWETGDLVADSWLNRESGVRTVLLKNIEFGKPFFCEPPWKFSAQNCLCHVQDPGGEGAPSRTAYSTELFPMRLISCSRNVLSC